jgi:hypothetical protein
MYQGDPLLRTQTEPQMRKAHSEEWLPVSGLRDTILFAKPTLFQKKAHQQSSNHNQLPTDNLLILKKRALKIGELRRKAQLAC